MRITTFLLIALIILSCSSEEDPQSEEAYSTEVITDYETLIEYDDEILLQPGTAVATDTHIMVFDGGDMKIKKLGKDGSLEDSFGGSGSGPGEFEGIQNLSLNADTISFYDNQNNRMNLFTSDGEFVDSYSYEFETLIFSEHLLFDGHFYATTSGVGNALLASYNRDGDQIDTWGEPSVELSEEGPQEIIQDALSQAENEEVPDMDKVQGQLAASSDYLWMKMAATDELYRIDTNGNKESFTFQIERTDANEYEYFEQMARMAENNQLAVGFMRYVDELYATEDYLYMIDFLQDSEKPVVMYQLNNDGQIEDRYKLEPFTERRYGFAISPDDEYLYLVDVEHAGLVRIGL